MKQLKPEFLYPYEEVNPKNIALMTTSRPDILIRTIEKLKSAFPAAELYLITQYGRENDVSKIMDAVKVIEALPGGKFKLWKSFGVKFSEIRNLQVDLLALPYNNPACKGYLHLEILTYFLGAKKVIGIAIHDEIQIGNTLFCELRFSKYLYKLFLRILSTPLEIALYFLLFIVSVAAKMMNIIRYISPK